MRYKIIFKWHIIPGKAISKNKIALPGKNHQVKVLVSRILSRAIIYLLSRYIPFKRDVTGRCDLPESQTKRAISPLILGLAPDGVYPAFTVTREAVGSYPAFSPLSAWGGRYIFCGTFHRLTPSLSPKRDRASCPVEFGLSSYAWGARDRLPHFKLMVI